VAALLWKGALQLSFAARDGDEIKGLTYAFDVTFRLCFAQA
jgi:hypothetical protein